MRETWYVLEDGTMGDPAEMAPDKSGRLRHKNGVAVAMRGEVPHTSGVDVEAERAKVRAKVLSEAKAIEDAKPKDVKPEEPKRAYKTRESKAE